MSAVRLCVMAFRPARGLMQAPGITPLGAASMRWPRLRPLRLPAAGAPAATMATSPFVRTMLASKQLPPKEMVAAEDVILNGSEHSLAELYAAGKKDTRGKCVGGC